MNWGDLVRQLFTTTLMVGGLYWVMSRDRNWPVIRELPWREQHRVRRLAQKGRPVPPERDAAVVKAAAEFHWRTGGRFMRVLWVLVPVAVVGLAGLAITEAESRQPALVLAALALLMLPGMTLVLRRQRAKIERTAEANGWTLDLD